MDIAELGRPQPKARERCWTVVLPRPQGADRFLRAETMNATELMFFFGAPLAHVIQYEEHLRESRREREFALARRTTRFIDPAAIAAPPARTRALELSDAPLG